MKLTSATLALALSGSAMAGGADGVNAVLTDIGDSIKKFDAAIKSWSTASNDQLIAASKKVGSATDAGTQKINAGESLSLVDAASITPKASGLKDDIEATLNDLQIIGKQLAAAGQCSAIQKELDSQGVSAQGLQDAIANKAPPEAKTIAAQLGGQIGAVITNTKAVFADLCAGAPSAPSSGGSGGATSSGGSGGAPKSSVSGAGAGSGGAPSSGGSPSSSGGSGSHGAGGHGSGTGASKPATTTAVPKPATYPGAGSTVKVPFAIVLALAVFAL